MGEWKNCNIGDLGTVITGKTPSTRHSNYWNGNTMFVTPKDIQGVKHIRTTERNITDSGLHSVHGSLLSPNAICVSCIGNIGYVAMTTQECVSNQQINSIITNVNNDADFVYYLMRNMWTFFKSYEGQSTALSILNKTQFSKIEVKLPSSLEEQKRIASILSSLDEKIELNKGINENLRKQQAGRNGVVISRRKLAFVRLYNGEVSSGDCPIANGAAVSVARRSKRRLAA